jgi:PKHD-type hydroxylase
LVASGISRKLSIVLQLSDPSEYEGGELQILTRKEPTSMQKKRGLITVFPAWTLHQVTPVIKGTRQTLVAWISGPAFK